MGLVSVLQNTDEGKSGALELNNLTYSFCLTNTTRSSNSFSMLTGATNFDVLLTVHLSIFISVFNQLDAQHLFHNKFYFMPVHVLITPIGVMIPGAV